MQPMVHFSGERDGDGQLLLTISDNGAGFGPEQARKLFQPFQRLHRHDEFQGTGIGLTIVQRIVQRHGGTITANGRRAPVPASSSAWANVRPRGLKQPTRCPTACRT